MTNLMRLVALIALTGALLGIASSEPAPGVITRTATAVPSVSETMPAAQTQADFDLMRKALEEAHSGLYRYSSKTQMECRPNGCVET